MLKVILVEEDGIAMLEPDGALSQQDFESDRKSTRLNSSH